MVSLMMLLEYEKIDNVHCPFCLEEIQYNKNDFSEKPIVCKKCLNSVSRNTLITTNRCFRCNYFQLTHTPKEFKCVNNTFGICRRFPPILDDGCYVYPTLNASNLICGEFDR